MRYLSLFSIAIALAGCDAARVIAPQTTAGFESNGILGALDGASGAILAKCQTLDGQELRVAIDTVGETTGKGELVDRVRAARKKACATAARVSAFVDEPVGEDPVVEPIDPVAAVPTDGATGQNVEGDDAGEKPASE